MKIISLLIAIIPVLAGQTGVIPVRSAAQPTVYIVSRATTAESRALFSARLLKLNVTQLYWYESGSVVRAQLSPTALEAVRADSDTVLVLSESDQPTFAPPLSSDPALTASPVPAVPSSFAAGVSPQPGCSGPVMPQPSGSLPPLGAVPPMPMGSMGVSSPIGLPGLGMGTMGVGLVDSLAGGVAQRILNRPPACKISVGRNAVKFGPEGGEGLVEINASGSCAWQAQASVTWIKILSGSGVSGSGIVSYSVDPATGKNRSGAIWIATSPAGSPIKGNASQVVTQTK